jgi:hypothetical protein
MDMAGCAPYLYDRIGLFDELAGVPGFFVRRAAVLKNV